MIKSVDKYRVSFDIATNDYVVLTEWITEALRDLDEIFELEAFNYNIEKTEENGIKFCD